MIDLNSLIPSNSSLELVAEETLMIGERLSV